MHNEWRLVDAWLRAATRNQQCQEEVGHPEVESPFFEGQIPDVMPKLPAAKTGAFPDSNFRSKYEFTKCRRENMLLYISLLLFDTFSQLVYR